MTDIGNQAFNQWKLAVRQANGDSEVIADILCQALCLALVEGEMSLEETVEYLRSEFSTWQRGRALATTGSEPH